MIKIKKILIGVLVMEIVCYGYWYVAGAQGLLFVQAQIEACEKSKNKRDMLNKEVMILNERIEAYSKYQDFYYEKVAREQLQMARSSDLIYYLS